MLDLEVWLVPGIFLRDRSDITCPMSVLICLFTCRTQRCHCCLNVRLSTSTVLNKDGVICTFSLQSYSRMRVSQKKV